MTGSDSIDPYARLDLHPEATLAEIKNAYFTLVRAHPPEREPEVFKEIRAAYEQLNTPEKRLETDMLRLTFWPELEPASFAPVDLSVDPADVIRAARAFSDLARRDWREDCREVDL